ncbi:MAG: MFS transporter [Candidatus Dormibacteraceae bacterium]
MGQVFRSLRVRNYRLYTGGQLISNTGAWVQRIAQDWLVLQLTHNNGTALGITTGLQFLPMLLFGLWGSFFGDRFPKRRVLLVTKCGMGVLAVILGLLDVSGVVQVWQVFMIAFLLGMVTLFDNPTRQTFAVEMVGKESLANAISLNSATFNVARLAGPAIAGGLIVAIGTGPLFFINAISYIGSIVTLLLIRQGELRQVEPVPRARRQIREGLRYVSGRPDLILPVFLMAFIATFAMNNQIVTALFATRVFGRGAGSYGLLTTAVAVGSLSGALLSASRTRPTRKLLLGAALGLGVADVVGSLMPSYLLFMALLIPVGLASMLFMTAANSLSQLGSSDQMRGRVMSLYVLVSMGGAPIGAPFVGWLADQYGTRWSLLSGGLVSIGAAIAATVLFLILRDGAGPTATHAVRLLGLGRRRASRQLPASGASGASESAK